MKYYKTLKQYKASNLVYDESNELATSYEWYWLAKRINGVMILNSFNYSSTTIRHAYKIRALFDKLGIQYIEIEAPKGLQNLDASKEFYNLRIKELQDKINNPRTRKTTNYHRTCEIKTLSEKLLVVHSLAQYLGDN